MSVPLKWQKCSVLITGASGFLGSHLVRELAGKGAEIHGVSRTRRGRELGVRWWRADLTSLAETRNVIAQTRPDIIYHLSSMAIGKRDLALVLPVFQSETIATVNLLTAVAETSIKRLIVAGSLEEPSGNKPPSSPYAAAKAASRLYGQMFHLLYKVPVVFPRIFMTYGPGQPDWKVIPCCIRTFLRGEQPRIASPDRRVDWIYVSDVIAGLIRIGEVPGLDGCSIDLGSGTLVEVRRMVREVERILCPARKAAYSRLGKSADEEVRCADLAAASARLGWRPVVPLEQGLRLTVDHLRGYEA
jgi:UDP-glucose 4-epimerase